MSITALRVTTTSYTIILLIVFFFYIKNENHTKIVPLKSLLTSQARENKSYQYHCENNKIVIIKALYINIASLVTTNGRIYCYLQIDRLIITYRRSRNLCSYYTIFKLHAAIFFISAAHE